MIGKIQILFVEDEVADAALVSHALRKAGLAFRLRRVETQEAFLEELTLNPPEVILSDHGLPSFDGFTALAQARERCPDTPFIFVTGGLGEEKTIEAFESGAADCILKQNLSKLAPAVLRASQEAKKKFLSRVSEDDRERLIGELYELLIAMRTDRALAICPSCRKIRDGKGRWLPIEIYLCDQLHATLDPEVCPDCTE